ncbi:MAG: zinc metalloprotease HtpX [Bacilli bacterium]
MNTLKTLFLMGLLSILIILLGTAFGGRAGALIALIVAIGINGAGYFFSDQLAISMVGAKPVTEHNEPQLYTIVRHLSGRAGLPMPKLYMAPSSQPNAFATGRNAARATIVVNEGLLRQLSERELTGVLAHEMSHIRHHDILIASVAATLAASITWLAQMMQWEMLLGGGRDRRNQNWIGDLALMILAPIAATLIQMAISRSREYKADAGAAHLTRDPDGLADALAKLNHVSRFGTEKMGTGRRRQPAAAAAMAHMYIVNPLRSQQMAGFFSTHPPTEERIKRLRLMRF